MKSEFAERNHYESVTEKFNISPAFSLAQALEDLGELISLLSDAEYSSQPSSLFTSSVGAQVRHTLDHVRIFVQGLDRGEIQYESRERGTNVEKVRSTALELIKKLSEELLRISPSRINDILNVHLMLHSNLEPTQIHSTVGREIAFLLNHTIHHNALMAVMLKQMGREVPDHFGFAPATLAFQNRSVRPS